jgi:hypothetical protein
MSLDEEALGWWLETSEAQTAMEAFMPFLQSEASEEALSMLLVECFKGGIVAGRVDYAIELARTNTVEN